MITPLVSSILLVSRRGASTVHTSSFNDAGERDRIELRTRVHRVTKGDASTVQTFLFNDTKSEGRDPASGSESPFSRRK